MSEDKHVETERGFGTGLPAQLAKRQEETTEAAEAQQLAPTQVTPIRSVEVEVRATDGATLAELESLRHELSSALTREHELRTTLESRLAADQGPPPALAADLEHRQSALDERERELAAQAELLADEHARVAQVRSEVAADESRVSERERQISTKFRELSAADRERTEAAATLAKQEAALAER